MAREKSLTWKKFEGELKDHWKKEIAGNFSEKSKSLVKELKFCTFKSEHFTEQHQYLKKLEPNP